MTANTTVVDVEVVLAPLPSLPGQHRPKTWAEKELCGLGPVGSVVVVAAAAVAGPRDGAGRRAGRAADPLRRRRPRRLPAWTGDRHRLSREVAPPDYVAEQLFTRLRQLELSTGRRAVVSEQPDGSYRIEVWTHSEDLVTYVGHG